MWSFPVLVDIDPKTLNISTSEVEKAITNKTKAIMPVHVTGRAADLEKLIEISKKYNIHIIEDAAEALMSKYKRKF